MWRQREPTPRGVHHPFAPPILESSCRSLLRLQLSREKLAAKLRDGGLELDASPSPPPWKLKIRAKPVRNGAGSLAFIFMWAKLVQLPVSSLVNTRGMNEGTKRREGGYFRR